MFEEYDNVELLGSSKFCPPTVIRNAGSPFMQNVISNILDTDNLSMDASGIAGDMELMIENHVTHDYCWAGSVIRQDNYFYMQHCVAADEGLHVIKVMEYNRDTNTHIEATVCSYRVGVYGGGGHIRLCLVGNRKVLVLSDHFTDYLGTAPNRYYTATIYSVDFSSGSGVVEEEFSHNHSYEQAVGSNRPPDYYMEEGESLISIEIAQEVWGIVVGNLHHTVDIGGGDWTYQNGVCVYYKNFTTGSAWSSVMLETEVPYPTDGTPGIEAMITCNPVVIGKDKIVISSYVYPWGTDTGYRGLEMWKFDLNTHALTRSGIGNRYGEETSVIAYDASSGYIYWVEIGPDEEDNYCLCAYNPSTDYWASNIWGDEDETWELYSYVLATNDHVYIYTDQGRRMLQANGLGEPVLLGVIPSGEFGWDSCYFCFAVDSYGPSVILYDCNGDTSSEWYLRHIGVDGTIHWSYTAAELGLTEWIAYPVHMVDSIALLESPFVNGHWLYYLLT